MTERDKKLITLLSIVVILVVFLNYLIMPMKKEGDELDTSIETAQVEKTQMQQKIDQLPMLEQNFNDLQQQYLDSAKEYYPIMTSQEIDREITSLVLSCGLSSEDLQISMPSDPTTLEAFYASDLALGNLVTDSMTGSVSDSSSAESSELSGAGSASTDAAAAAAESEASSSTDSGTTAATGNGNTEIYAVQVNITAEGSDTAFEKLIDTLTNNYPTLRVTGYSYQTKQGTVSYDETGKLVSNAAGRILTLNLELYMCSKTFN